MSSDESKVFSTLAERKTIPVVGGPLDGCMLARRGDKPLMQIPIETPYKDGQRPQLLRLMFKYKDSKWYFLGWGDHDGDVIAPEGSPYCLELSALWCGMVSALRKKAEATKQTYEPLGGI